MRAWTPERVAARFEQAADTLRKLPPAQYLGHNQYWPELVYTPREIAQQETLPLRLQATPQQITRMEEVLTWVTWVKCEESRKILWLRAHRYPWRAIARETGCPVTTARRFWQQKLLEISNLLQHRPGR